MEENIQTGISDINIVGPEEINIFLLHATSSLVSSKGYNDMNITDYAVSPSYSSLS